MEPTNIIIDNELKSDNNEPRRRLFEAGHKTNYELVHSGVTAGDAQTVEDVVPHVWTSFTSRQKSAVFSAALENWPESRILSCILTAGGVSVSDIDAGWKKLLTQNTITGHELGALLSVLAPYLPDESRRAVKFPQIAERIGCDFELWSILGVKPFEPDLVLQNTPALSIASVEKLKVFGANTDHLFDDGSCVVGRAIGLGDVVKVRSLLTAGANPNGPHGVKASPLKEALKYGSLEILKLLVEFAPSSSQRT